MKLKLEQIFAIQQILPKLISQDMPIKYAYKISKFAKQIEIEHMAIEKQRRAAVEKYGEVDPQDDKRKIVSNPEKLKQFREEFQALLEEKTEIDCDTISLSELPDLKLNAQDMIILDCLFKEGEAE